MIFFRKKIWMLPVITALFVTGIGRGESTQQASRLFDRLAGVPLPLNDSRRPAMEKLLQQGKWLDAAHIATDDNHFYDVTLKHWASALSNRSETPLVPFNDFMAMIIGTVRDGRDFREILSGNYTYTGPTKLGATPLPDPVNSSAAHYETLETLLLNQGLTLRNVLIRHEPQQADSPDSAGVLTSSQWGKSHLEMGTNRRAIEFSFREFLCTSLDELGDASVPDFRVRRDVDRAPGGTSQTYFTTCRRCHGGMDALGGAYAHFRFGFIPPSNGRTVYEPRVQRKMNQNGDVYPEGYVTTDDSWMNLWTKNQNAQLGWRGPLKGFGIQQFGAMLANSQAFSRCMAKRVFTNICHREPDASERPLLASLGESFEAGGYSLKALFEQVAIVPGCVIGKN